MNKNIKTQIIFILLSVSLLICLSACSSMGIPIKTNSIILKSKPQATETYPIPASIIEKSNQFIVSKVGQEYFSRYITFNNLSSIYAEATQGEHISAYLRNPYYYMIYSLKIPDKPFANGIIEFAVDINGKVITESEPKGIPNIIKDPAEGEFPIDEQMAIDIAKKAGLEAGIKKWETKFSWHGGELDTYVWGIQNSIGENRGKGILIDANTGTVLQTYLWDLIIN